VIEGFTVGWLMIIFLLVMFSMPCILLVHIGLATYPNLARTLKRILAWFV
jgi:hypothetical protein